MIQTLKIPFLLIPALIISYANSNPETKIVVSDDLQMESKFSVREDDKLYFKFSSTFKESLIQGDCSFGMIMKPYFEIQDSDALTLDTENIVKINVNQEDLVLKNDVYTIKGYSELNLENINNYYMIKSYVSVNNTTYYSSNYAVLHPYKIIEKIISINDEEQSLLDKLKIFKSYNDDGLIYEYNQATSSYSITGFKDSVLSNVRIPSIYNNLPVTTIKEGAFKNSNIEYLQIPDSIETIGLNAFKGSSKMTIYCDGEKYNKSWGSTFNSDYIPIYFNVLSRKKHLNYISRDKHQMMNAYIHQILKGGVAIFNQENNPIRKFHYSDALMMNALLNMYEVYNESYYLSQTETYMKKMLNLSKGWIYKPAGGQLDSLPGGVTLIRLTQFTKNKNYIKYVTRMLDILFSSRRIDDEGHNFHHKNDYPNQIWLDGLYMAMPLYSLYESVINNDGEYKSTAENYAQKYNPYNTNRYEDIYKQYKYVNEHMRNKTSGLYYHGFDYSGVQAWSLENKENPKCSLSFWGRGMGWLVASLADVIEYMDVKNETEQSYKDFLSNMLKTAIEDVYKFADERTMMFYQVLDKQNEVGNYLEVSGSALICYAALKAVRLGILPEEYYEKGLATFNGILDEKMYYNDTEKRYTIKDINKVAGLSATRNGTYEYYISESKVNDNAKGSGPLIMAYAELIR